MGVLEDLLGKNPVRCSHKSISTSWMRKDSNIPSSSMPGSTVTEGEDFNFAVQQLGFDPQASSIGLCWDCQDKLPSKHELDDLQSKQAKRLAGLEETEKEVLLSILDEGGELFQCTDCKALSEESVVIRNCPHCDEDFVAEEGERNCETCNRPFTSLVHEHGCADCLEEARQIMSREEIAA